jgi:hypothetical protein
MDNFTQQPEEIMNFNSSPVQDGNPYFMGDEALIRFSSGEEGMGQNTFWLVDKKNNTIRPFESDMALDATFGDDLKDALQNVVIVTSPKVDQDGEIIDGVLSGFSILGPEYSIREDGTSKPLRFSSSQLKGRYGKPVDENIEKIATEVLDGFLEILKKNESKTKIPANFINQIKKDSRHMAFYISALAYGGYTLRKLYSDISASYNDSKQ